MLVESKSPFQSKTMWANGLLGLALLIPGVQKFIVQNPGVYEGATAILNMVLRKYTKQPVK